MEAGIKQSTTVQDLAELKRWAGSGRAIELPCNLADDEGQTHAVLAFRNGARTFSSGSTSGRAKAGTPGNFVRTLLPTSPGFVN